MSIQINRARTELLRFLSTLRKEYKFRGWILVHAYSTLPCFDSRDLLCVTGRERSPSAVINPKGTERMAPTTWSRSYTMPSRQTQQLVELWIILAGPTVLFRSELCLFLYIACVVDEGYSLIRQTMMWRKLSRHVQSIGCFVPCDRHPPYCSNLKSIIRTWRVLVRDAGLADVYNGAVCLCQGYQMETERIEVGRPIQ